jgi:predicted amidohydrolase
MQGFGMCPEPSSGLWRLWYPENSPRPLFHKGDTFTIETHRFDEYGKWICSVQDINGIGAFSFSVDYQTEGVRDTTASVYAMLTWVGRSGEMLARDYADDACPVDAQWKRFEKYVEPPDGAQSVEVELALRWAPSGRVVFRNPCLAASACRTHRILKIATTAMPAHPSVEKNEHTIERIVCDAAENDPDIICLREALLTFGTGLPPRQYAQPVPGPLSEKIGRLAASARACIVYNSEELQDGLVYNTSVFVDRTGNIVSKYRKTHLPLVEAEAGIIPGSEYPVFGTEFGIFGMLTCYDMFFPEPARILKRNGAEIIFIPTLGHTPNQVIARAADNGLFVVVASRRDFPEEASCIIDPSGNRVCQMDYAKADFAIAEIDLNRKYCQEWLSVGPGLGDPQSLFMKERRPSTYGMLVK